MHDLPSIISVANLSKTYASGFQALKNIDLEIKRGEIFALLGPNGAGKTTLISIICGIVTPTEGRVSVDGHDILADYRAARAMIGLVPQELTTDAFESVWATVLSGRGRTQRGRFKKCAKKGYLDAHICAGALRFGHQKYRNRSFDEHDGGFNAVAAGSRP